MYIKVVHMDLIEERAQWVVYIMVYTRKIQRSHFPILFIYLFILHIYFILFIKKKKQVLKVATQKLRLLSFFLLAYKILPYTP